MTYFRLLSDYGMNYTANRPFGDGAQTARIDLVRRLAPRITDLAIWSSVWLEQAELAQAQGRWSDAAAYFHNAEFYLPAGEARNGLYDSFARNFARAMAGVAGYERISVPYESGHLPGFRLAAEGKALATFIFHGGYDSFVEEFYPFLAPLTKAGYAVIAFDGPGQGGALRQGLHFTHEWEKPAKAVLDHFKLDAVDWLGASCGGYLALRAAAFEPRIRHVIALPATYWGLDMSLKQMEPGRDRQLHAAFLAEDWTAVEEIVAEQRQRRSCFDWCITQGMHITGTPNPSACLSALARHSLDGILKHLRQDVFLTEGEQDHLFPVGRLHRIMAELTSARSLSVRIFTGREGAEQHCQVGNSGLARQEIVRWLAPFHPGMSARLSNVAL